MDFFLFIIAVNRLLLKDGVLYSHLHYHSASQRHNIKDRRMKENAVAMTDARRKTSLTLFYLSLYCKISKGLLKICM